MRQTVCSHQATQHGCPSEWHSTAKRRSPPDTVERPPSAQNPSLHQPFSRQLTHASLRCSGVSTAWDLALPLPSQLLLLLPLLPERVRGRLEL